MKNLHLRIISIALVMALLCAILPSAFADYYPAVDSDYCSLVDALKSIGVDSSFSFRAVIANENGIYDYQGTADQNIYLLDLLKSGELVIPGTSAVTSYEEYPTPEYEDTWDYDPDYSNAVAAEACFPACSTNYYSLVDALKSIGVDSSYNYRCRIAIANEISDYHGTVEQNTYLLNLLEGGRLRRPEFDYASSTDEPSNAGITITGYVGDLSSASITLDVTRDNAPVRSGASAHDSVIVRCARGAVIASSGSCWNQKHNEWYMVDIDGKTGYIYSGNVSVHNHTYREFPINNVTYRVCSCGMVTAEADNAAANDEAVKVMSSISLALPLAAADGPLPIGDIAAAIIAVVAVCVAHDYAVPAATEIVSAVTETQFVDFLRNRDSNSCSPNSFRRVQRYPGGLKYLDEYCMDRVEACLYVQLTGGDVYTADEDEALLLAAMFGAAICERDAARPSKDITTYFYHYHLGTNRAYKGHVFFGLNDAGVGPTW